MYVLGDSMRDAWSNGNSDPIRDALYGGRMATITEIPLDITPSLDHHLSVVSGPSMWDLMLALFEPGDRSNPRTVRFVVDELVDELDLSVTGLDRANDLGWFLVRGNWVNDQHLNRKVEILFSTRNRIGSAGIDNAG